MPSPALPGLFFAFAGMVLLLFASISPPAWTAISFLDVNAGGTRTLFGVFGRCTVGAGCSGRSVGYDLVVAGAQGLDLSQETVLRRLTVALIIHPVAGGIALLAFFMGLMGVICASRFATVMMGILSALGAFAALVIFVIDMVLWNLVRNRVQDAGYTATLGNCNWFTIGASVSLFIAMCASFCGAFGRFASGRMAGEKY